MPMGVYGWLLVPIDAYGWLLVPIEANGWSLVPMDGYWSLWMVIGAYGC